jgi:hypothetical protein
MTGKDNTTALQVIGSSGGIVFVLVIFYAKQVLKQLI